MSDAKPEIWFYHLERSTLDQVLPGLLEKTLQRGWRALVRGAVAHRLDDIDEHLWTYRADSFLPHGLAGGPQDADQPCLLVWHEGAASTLPNRPRCLIAVDGAAVGADEARGLERLCVVFDGTDEVALQRARSQWRDLTAAGVEAEYWSRESGRWDCKARHPK